MEQDIVSLTSSGDVLFMMLGAVMVLPCMVDSHF